jgi:hypothetical protein
MHIDCYKLVKNKSIFIKTGYGNKLIITRYDHEKILEYETQNYLRFQ